MVVLDYLKVLAITALTTYPFWALVSQLSSIATSNFVPCNDRQCAFIKLFSDMGTGTTMINGQYRLNSNPFLTVRNGDANISQTLGSYLPPLCPGMSSVEMRSFCAGDEVKLSIINTLRQSTSRLVYMYAVFGWFSFKVVHDWLVLSHVDEFTTLMVGIASVFFQMIAVAAAFLWSMRASEVFVAKTKNEGCSCYFQLPELAVLLSIATPTALYCSMFLKLEAVHRSVLFGDYLYFVQYDVPFHYVATSLPTNPSGSLLIGTLVGKHRVKERDPLPIHQLKIIRSLLELLNWFVFALVKVCVGIAIGPLTDRLIEYASMPESRSWVLSVSAGMIALATIPACIVAHYLELKDRFIDFTHMNVSQVFLEYSGYWRLGQAAWAITWFFASAYACWELVLPIASIAFGGNIDNGPDAALKRAVAAVIMFFLFTRSAYYVVLRPIRGALELKVRAFSPSQCIQIASAHPEFELDTVLQIVKRFLRREATSVRDKEWWSRWEATLSEEHVELGQSDVSSDESDAVCQFCV